MEYPEAAAWFELGRSWVSLHLACIAPVAPAPARKEQWQHFLQFARAVSLPVDASDIASPVKTPELFDAQAGATFQRLHTLAGVGRGERAAEVFQIGAAYRSLLNAKHSKSNSVTSLIENMAEALRDLGVAATKRKSLIAHVQAFLMAPKRTSEKEVELARELGDAVAKVASAPQGLKIGDATLPNTVRLKNGRSLSLPKRLIGYRSEIEAFLSKHPYDRNVFLMMPFRDVTVSLRTTVRQTCKKYKLHLVVADEHRIIDNDLNGNVLACLVASRFGIAVFTKPETAQTINPNVAYELGLMHRDDKVCLLLKHARLKHLQTDLVAHLYVEVDPSDKQALV